MTGRAEKCGGGAAEAARLEKPPAVPYHPDRTDEVRRALAKVCTSVGLGDGRKGQFSVGEVKDVGWQWCRLLQRGDGYGYTAREAG
jgi:hypothetical protein